MPLAVGSLSGSVLGSGEVEGEEAAWGWLEGDLSRGRLGVEVWEGVSECWNEIWVGMLGWEVSRG